MSAPDPKPVAPPGFAYQAFISYSHSADGKFAPALQAGLQQFAKPWHRMRAIRVFRDQTGLAVTPHLWSAIVAAMDGAEYFLLLASPQAAQSHWVDQEVRHWLSRDRAGRLLIVVTDGSLRWDATGGAPDESGTDVLPPSLRQRADEPLWLDLRWARASEDLSLQNPAWRDAIASLSSTIRGIPKDQLIGEDVRQHARATRFRRATFAGLACLTLALGIAAAVAVQQRDLARSQARIAQARQLAAQAELIRSQQPERLPLALLMATEATRSHADSVETQQVLQSVLSLFPTPVATLPHQSPVTAVDVSADQQLLATAAEEDPGLWRITDGTRLATLRGANRLVRFSPDGTRVAGCCDEVGDATRPRTQAAALRLPLSGRGAIRCDPMPTIDAFTHFMPARFLEMFLAHAPDQGMFRRSMQVEPLCDLEARFRLMDHFGDYRQVISLGSPPIETFVGPDEAPRLAQAGNEGMAELVDRHPDRFAGFLAAVPMSNPDAAVEEIQRAMRDLRASGVQIYSNTAGKPLDRPELAPVFDLLNRERIPVFLHPARSERFADYATEDRSKFEIWWALGWPYETSTAMARLVFSGAFDRWPDLVVVCHHLGGIVPYLAGRVGYGWDQLGKRTSDEDYYALLKSMARRPLDYFKMFYGDTAEFGSAAATRCGLDFFGVDHVLFASDCPFEPTPGIYVRETLQVVAGLGLSADDHLKIVEGNARRLMPNLRL